MCVTGALDVRNCFSVLAMPSGMLQVNMINLLMRVVHTLFSMTRVS